MMLTITGMIFMLVRFVIIHIITMKKYGRHENFDEDLYITAMCSVGLVIANICLCLYLEV